MKTMGFGQFISDYLVTEKIPLISYDSKAYYFEETQELKDALKRASFWIKAALWGESKEYLIKEV